jgi:predicted nucleotidyltransferase component of viral defense system
MLPSAIEERVKQYAPKTTEDEENALKEILQEIALYALATSDFFSKALFQGGTALRILYKLPRFSEDLDFILKTPDSSFGWQPYLDKMFKVFELFGITPEVTDRNKAGALIQTMFLKDNSIGKLLSLQFKQHGDKKLKIKLEIDTNPPLGSHEENKFLDFPMDYRITTQDLSSNFAGKCHALLCRPYVKGRDWFDLTWYLTQKTPVNFSFLQNALQQAGPWVGEIIDVNSTWLFDALMEKIQQISWDLAKTDAIRFVNGPYKESIQLWDAAFFSEKIKRLLG